MRVVFSFLFGPAFNLQVLSLNFATISSMFVMTLSSTNDGISLQYTANLPASDTSPRPAFKERAIDRISTNPNDTMTFYILITISTAFDPTHGGRVGQSLATDKSTIPFMKNTLGPSSDWKDSGLQAIVTLKWTLFMGKRHHDHLSRTRKDSRWKNWNRRYGTRCKVTRSHTSRLPLHNSRNDLTTYPSSYTHLVQITPEQDQQREPPAEEFKLAVLNAFDVLARSLITYWSCCIHPLVNSTP